MIGLNILSEMIKFSYIPHEKQPDTKASTTEDINNKATEDSNGQSFDVASSIRRDQFSKMKPLIFLTKNNQIQKLAQQKTSTVNQQYKTTRTLKYKENLIISLNMFKPIIKLY